MSFFANRPAARVVIEACGSAHYWARTLGALGHEVRLVHARHVRPYVRGNKNDAADARAISSAAHQPGLRWVPAKSEQQQAVPALHRVRSQYVKTRTQMVNGLRGLLYEFGVVLPGAPGGPEVDRGEPRATGCGAARADARVNRQAIRDARWTASSRTAGRTR